MYLQKLLLYNKVIANRESEVEIQNNNEACEKIFVQWVRRFDTEKETPTYQDITVDILTKHPLRDYTHLPSFTNKLLHAFIRARRPATITKSTGKMRFYSCNK